MCDNSTLCVVAYTGLLISLVSFSIQVVSLFNSYKIRKEQKRQNELIGKLL